MCFILFLFFFAFGTAQMTEKYMAAWKLIQTWEIPNDTELLEYYHIKEDKDVDFFKEYYKSALEKFPTDEYRKRIYPFTSVPPTMRFLQMAKNYATPHCDSQGNGEEDLDGVETTDTLYPGGSYARSFGSDTTKSMGQTLENGSSMASMGLSAVSNVSKAVTSMITGMLLTLLASVIDFVPPLIPPPFWYLRPLPCLPMLFGPHCLASILYPITAPDSVLSSVTDKSMEGIIASFPAKYAAVNGRRSDQEYYTCAQAYLGLYCSSLFRMCILPIGMRTSETIPFATCAVSCLLALQSCNKFTLADLGAPCASISLPPFCSFSYFARRELIPPQLTSYDEGNPYPSDCPANDSQFDGDDAAFDAIGSALSPLEQEMAVDGIIEKNFGDFLKNNSFQVPKACDCSCYVLPPLPQFVTMDRKGWAKEREKWNCDKDCEEECWAKLVAENTGTRKKSSIPQTILSV